MTWSLSLNVFNWLSVVNFNIRRVNLILFKLNLLYFIKLFRKFWAFNWFNYISLFIFYALPMSRTPACRLLCVFFPNDTYRTILHHDIKSRIVLADRWSFSIWIKIEKGIISIDWLEYMITDNFISTSCFFSFFIERLNRF